MNMYMTARLGVCLCVFWLWTGLGVAFAKDPISLFEDEDSEPSSSTQSKTNAILFNSGASLNKSGTVVRFVRRGNTMFVRAQVQGRPAFFMLDTGASITTLSIEVAHELGIAPGPRARTLRFQTANGTSSSKIGTIGSLVLGGMEHRDVTYAVCATCAHGSIYNIPVVGLLGMNVMGRYRMHINERRGQLKLTPWSKKGAHQHKSTWQLEPQDPPKTPSTIAIQGSGATLSGLGRAKTVKFVTQKGIMLVPAKIQGHKVYFIFDTGASFTTLHANFARKAGVLPGTNAPTITLNTANGQLSSNIGLVPKFSFASINLSYISYTLCHRCPTGRYKGKPIVGLLGMNVLLGFRIDVDHATHTITLHPQDPKRAMYTNIKPWVSFSLWSLHVHNNGHKVLVYVHNKSPRRIRHLMLRVVCTDRRGRGRIFVGSVSSVAPASKVLASLPGGRVEGGECTNFKAKALSASW